MIRPSTACLAAHAEALALVAAFVASGRVITGAAPETAPETPEASPVTCDGSVGWASRSGPLFIVETQRRDGTWTNSVRALIHNTLAEALACAAHMTAHESPLNPSRAVAYDSAQHVTFS